MPAEPTSLGEKFTVTVSRGEKLGAAGDDLVKAGNRSKENLEFERAIVSFFMEAAALIGIPRSIAAIYGICFASAKPLRFAEVKARLTISAGSVSQGLRVLRDVGALKTVEIGKMDCFEPDLKLRRLIAHFVEQRLDRHLKAGHHGLEIISNLVPTSDSQGILRLRLHALRVWYEQADAVVPLLRSFLAVPR